LLLIWIPLIKKITKRESLIAGAIRLFLLNSSLIPDMNF